ncbi:hypothetical protein Amn_06790 [Aminobacter sp. Y103A]|nr:hypothetical protein Amn_06790 [Aminobacter sp. SS-2016]
MGDTMARKVNSVEPDWQVALDTLQKDLNLSDDAIGVFALQLKFRLEDIEAVAAEAITGGGDDKKCDVIYVDKEQQIAVIAQCYRSKKSRNQAPANKASDLNAAVSWLLGADVASLPVGLQSRATELRDAIKDGQVKQLFIWYVHNLPESKQVAEELKTVERTARSVLHGYESGNEINVFAEEISAKHIEKFYVQAERVIFVTDTITADVPDAIEIAGSDWSSVVTSVSGKWLYKIFKQHGANLFSANLRGYLGSRASDSNINHGIKQSAENESENFWVYNNGLTAFVIDYELGPRRKSGRRLKLVGISIVNGAQTTGSIGSLDEAPSDDLLIPVRFVKSNDEEIITNVVRFNNSQNKLQAADFRSTDQIQERLRSEFEKIPDAEYEGGRRGGASDTIKRRKNLLPSYTVGQALAAFHGDPVNAYDKKSEIWVSEALYRRFFTERTTARHIVFCYSLLDAINRTRLALLEKSKKKPESVTEIEKDQLDFLNRKGASYLLIYAISQSIETVYGKSVSNRFDLQFKDNIKPDVAAKRWLPIIEVFLSLHIQLEEAFSRNRISNESVRKAVPKFVGVVASLRKLHQTTFNDFSKNLQV